MNNLMALFPCGINFTRELIIEHYPIVIIAGFEIGNWGYSRVNSVVAVIVW